MRVGQRQLLPQQFASPVGRDWVARVGFLCLPTAPTRTRCCLARKIDEFFETGVVFDAGLDKVLRTQGIHFEIGFFFDGRYRTRKMKHLIDVFHTLFERIPILAISDYKLNGGLLHPPQKLLIPNKASDLDSSLNEGFHQVTPDKSCRSCNQSLQLSFPR
jgi:hypothetical protein